LLAMLAVLSLPLLIVSVFQLNNYRKSVDDQAALVVRFQTRVAADTVATWLRDRSSQLVAPGGLPDDLKREIYTRLQQHAMLVPGSAMVVLDEAGRVIDSPGASRVVPVDLRPPIGEEKRAWSDGVSRVTSVTRIEPEGWTVVVGLPLNDQTTSGHSIFVLSITWGLTLLASVLLGVWAAGRFTKPLRQLAESASNLGAGHLHERVPVETNDEVGSLAQDFNIMATQLQAKFTELQTQSAFIEEVLDGLPLGVAVIDTTLIVRKVNATFARLIGREATELAGRGLYEAAAGMSVLSDVVEDVRRARRPFVTYGLPLSLVAPATSTEQSEGSSFWDITIWPTTERSSVRGDLILILSEVSKRVRAERLATVAFAAERTRAAELESVINQMNEGVIIVDRQGRCKVNPAGVGIIGQIPSEMRVDGKAVMSEIGLRDLNGLELAPAQTPLWRAFEQRKPVVGESFQLVRVDGQKRVISLSATPLTGENNVAEGAVAVFRDITEEVEQRKEMVAAYDRLREHDRLKSAFVSNITHELRTPLNVIIGLCQLLKRDRQIALAPLQEEAIGRMERNARALLELVNDLLDYSRLEAGRAALHLEKVDIAELVETIIQDYAAETKEKRIDLHMEVSQELGTVITDRHKLSQVLSNLIGNAVKFTAVGSVNVTAGALDAENWYIEVSDTGIGISSDALTYIFDEFRQVDDRLARAFGGTGLGLAITRKIVELLEGEIMVKSQPTEGSRFRITWPRIVRQRTGTGSLLGQAAPAPIQFADRRLRLRS
jgi:PAS domain S-box-containing protein